MRKVFALILAMLLVMSLSATAFADNVTLTVNGENTGHTYVAYQIFSGDVNSQHVISNVQWGSGIVDGAALLAALKADNTDIVNAQDSSQVTSMAREFADATDAASVALKMADWGDNRERIDYFADFLYRNGHLSGNYSTATETSSKVYQFSLAPGYYLIKDKDGTVNNTAHDFYTKIIVELTANSTVAVKGTVPTVTKRVSATLDNNYDHQISNMLNKVHYYQLSGTIPTNIEDYTSYYYEFVDTLSEGLTFVQFEEIYLLRNNSDRFYFYKYNDDTIPTNVKPQMSNGLDANRQLHVSWDNLMADGFPTLLSSDRIVVRYSAMLNEKAVVGNDGTKNEVKLVYSNDPHADHHGTTVPDEARVYTFGMDLTKIDGATKNEENPTKLPNAKFILYHNHAPLEASGSPIHVYAVVENGMIVRWSEDIDEATELVTDADGKISVKGLNSNQGYFLRETEAPSGYNKLGTDIKFQITSYNVDATTDKVTSIVYEANSNTNTLNGDTAALGMIHVTVENKGGATLPSTGGMGTTILYIAGSVLVLAAVVMLVTKKRMANSR